MTARAGIVLVLALSSSCLTVGVRYAGPGGARPVIYQLDYPAPQADACPNGLVMRVRDFTCASEYDGTRMVLVDGEGRVTRTSRNRWVAGPGSMIGDLLARDLIAEGLFSGIYRRTPLSGDDLELDGYVRRFGAREAGGSWQAVLDLEVIVTESVGGAIVYQKPYMFSVPTDSAGGFRRLASDLTGLVRQCSEAVRSDLKALYGAPAGSGR